MDHQKINTLSTTFIAFFAFLATWAAIIYYLKESFNLPILTLFLISEIYILLTLLFVSWIKRKIL